MAEKTTAKEGWLQAFLQKREMPAGRWNPGMSGYKKKEAGHYSGL
jgi:hypothetical protein